VRDIGTRFEVRFNGSALRVRVRDGVVRLSQTRQSHDAQPGDELTLDGSGAIVRRTVPVHGADWAWAMALARPFDLEGRSLRDFLDWIAGENGWQLRFADAAVDKKSLTTILHGSIQGLTPDEALAAVLPTSGVEHRLENGVLLIKLGAGGTKE
jgi:ferric-dicitrate binding protein FerR (iron transport regulator)